MPPVQVSAYEVLGGVGRTVAFTVPESAPPVLKPLPPEHETAQVEPAGTDQVRLVFWPCCTVSGVAMSVAAQA